MKVVKRDGRVVDFDKEKIINAVSKAYIEVYDEDSIDKVVIDNVIKKVEGVEVDKINVEDIQDMVEDVLMDNDKKVARAYVRYRYDREKARALFNGIIEEYKQIRGLIDGSDENTKKENSNKDTRIIPTMRDYIAGFTCRRIANELLLPEDVREAHEKGIIHFHDSDYSPAMPMTNCCLVNLEDMLQNGTIISETMIEKPKSFRTACTIATQIIAQVASSQYGGTTISVAHLAPFVDVSRQAYIKEVTEEFIDNDIPIVEEKIKNIANKRLAKEIKKGIETIQFQLITISTTNGQSPFITLFMALNEAKNKQEEVDIALIIEEILKQRIAGVKNKKGVPITIAFPKLIYCLDENNITEDSEYWYLTKLAAECSAKRLVPDYISAKVMRELKEGNVFPNMSCRSFLSPWKDENGDYKFYGRFNQGVVTLNLPYISLLSKTKNSDFKECLDEYLDICYKALMIRHNSLLGTKSDVAPILWQHGAFTRFKEGEVIDKLLYGGYSTISLGYAGLWECVKIITGETLLEPIGYKKGIEIMQYLTDKCEEWKNKTNIGFSLYGTPIESTTYKFAKALRRDFEEIKGITDKNYVTNSYHITPSQEIDAFSKLSIEGEFQKLSQGGCISYCETPNMVKNIPALLQIIQHIYNNTMYAEINTMTSYCHECGCTDIKMEDDLKFHCPTCGNDDFDKMNIALRICGYISTNPFNDGRAEDIHDRVYHIDDIEEVL